MSKIKPEILAMSKAVLASIEVSKDNQFAPKGNPFIETLPEGLTEEHVTNVREHTATFNAGSALAFGELAIKQMAGDKKLDRAEITFNVGGKDELTHSLQRTREAINPSTKESVTKYGAMTTVHTVRGSVQKLGQLGAVRAQLGEMAIEKLAGK